MASASISDCARAAEAGKPDAEPAMFGRDEKVSAIRLTATQYIILGIFLVLAYGLWRLQVMQSDFYSLAAERNRIRNVPVLAPRGKILDREGRTIVDNYPSFSALLLRRLLAETAADADLIAQGLHLDPNEVRELASGASTSMPQYQPIFLKEDITPTNCSSLKRIATSCAEKLRCRRTRTKPSKSGKVRQKRETIVPGKARDQPFLAFNSNRAFQRLVTVWRHRLAIILERGDRRVGGHG